MKNTIKGINKGSSRPVKGKLKIINNFNNINTIQKGDIAFIDKKAFHGDSLFIVYRTIAAGAAGIILTGCSHTDHGIVAAKELGIPVLIVQNKIKKLPSNRVFTLSGDNLIEGETDIKIINKKYPFFTTRHKVKVNLGFPLTVKRIPELVKHSDGVGFARLEFSLLDILENTHPLLFFKTISQDNFATQLANNLEAVVKAFGKKPVWFRTDDFSCEQLIQMKGGKKYEFLEPNVSMGWRGIRRSIIQEDLIIPQLKAIRKLVDKGYSNIGLFPPMTTEYGEYKQWLKLAASCGLTKKNIAFGLMVETPSCALTIEDFLKDISYVVFGTNDLTQFTLAVDRLHPKLTQLFDERKPAVIFLLKHVIQICNKNNVETFIGGQAGSNPDLLEPLLQYGLSGTSVNPDLETLWSVKSFIKKYEESSISL